MLCKQHELLDLSGEARPRDLMRHMLERIRDDRVFYRELVLNELDWRFLEVLSGSLSQFIERVRRECPTEADVEPSLSSLYCAGGMANLVFWWVRNDFPLSVDELAEAQRAHRGKPGRLPANGRPNVPAWVKTDTRPFFSDIFP